MAGRKKAKIDWPKVNTMLEMGATGTGVASTLGIHPDTLYNACQELYKMDFSAYRQQKVAKGDEVLRAAQYKTATGYIDAVTGERHDPDKTMLIWLGKQRLGQSEKSASEINLQADVDVGFTAFAQMAEKLYGNNTGSKESD